MLSLSLLSIFLSTIDYNFALNFQRSWHVSDSIIAVFVFAFIYWLKTTDYRLIITYVWIRFVGKPFSNHPPTFRSPFSLTKLAPTPAKSDQMFWQMFTLNSLTSDMLFKELIVGICRWQIRFLTTRILTTASTQRTQIVALHLPPFTLWRNDEETYLCFCMELSTENCWLITILQQTLQQRTTVPPLQ